MKNKLNYSILVVFLLITHNSYSHVFSWISFWSRPHCRPKNYDRRWTDSQKKFHNLSSKNVEENLTSNPAFFDSCEFKAHDNKIITGLSAYTLLIIYQISKLENEDSTEKLKEKLNLLSNHKNMNSFFEQNKEFFNEEMKYRITYAYLDNTKELLTELLEKDKKNKKEHQKQLTLPNNDKNINSLLESNTEKQL